MSHLLGETATDITPPTASGMFPIALPPDVAEALDGARARVASASADLEKQRNEVSRREQRLTKAKTELDRLLDLEKEELVARILGGDEQQPAHPRRRSRLANLKQEVEGLTLALPKLRDRVREAQQAVVVAREAYTTALLPVICDERTRTLTELRDRLSQLAPLLVRLAASDIAQERLIGQSFTFQGARADIFSGLIVAQRVVQNLPERLRTPELSPDALLAAAQEAGAAFSNILQGE